MEFHKLSALEIAEGVKNGKWKASEVLSAHLERIRKYDGRINSWSRYQRALCKVEAVGRAVAEGRDGHLPVLPVRRTISAPRA